MANLIKTDRNGFISALKQGDVGVILAKNFFSTLQNWQRLKNENVPLRASHAFMMKTPPLISEANGLFIAQAEIGKFIGNKTQCWIYRYTKATPEEIKDTMLYLHAAEQNGATYSMKGIVQFGLNYFSSFFGKRIKFKDQPGSFCSEYVGKTVQAVGWPYIQSQKDYEVSPSEQRSWLANQAQALGYEIVGQWADGEYKINTDLIPQRVSSGGGELGTSGRGPRY